MPQGHVGMMDSMGLLATIGHGAGYHATVTYLERAFGLQPPERSEQKNAWRQRLTRRRIGSESRAQRTPRKEYKVSPAADW